MEWRVWITGYEGSGVGVRATGINEAIQEGAKTQKASHHGEVVEINVRRVLTTITYSYFVRIYPGGRVRYEGKS